MSDIEFTENNERTYIQNEMEEIIRNVVRQMDVEKEEKANGSEIPLDISNELANTPSYQLQENFKKFRRETQPYMLDEWTTPEKINKLSYLISRDTQLKQQLLSTQYTKSQKTLDSKPELQWKSLSSYNTCFKKQPLKQKQLQLLINVENKADVWQSLGLQQQKHKKGKQEIIQTKPLTSPSVSDIWSQQKRIQKPRMPTVMNFSTNSTKQTLNRNLFNKPVEVEEAIEAVDLSPEEMYEEVEVSGMEEEMVHEDLFLAREPLRDGEPTEQLQLTPKPSTSPSQQQHPQQPIISTANYSIPTDGIASGGRLQQFHQWQSMTRHS